MQATHRPSRTGALVRHLILTPALALTLTLALTAAASAQTSFQANVSAHNPLPKPCPDGAFLCGTATTSYGSASWTFDLTNLTPASGTCDAYQATVTFELRDGSTLAVSGNARCPRPA